MVNAKHTSASTLRVVAALGAALVGIASACSDSTTSGPGDAASTLGQGGATGGAAGVSSGSGGTSNGGATPEGGTSNGGANREGGTPSGGTTNTGGGNGSGGADGATPGGSIGNDGSGKADASNARDAAQEATVVRDAATDALVTPARGGSSARTVCPMGMTFGNPLTGMGPVTQLSPPSTPPANSFVFLEGPVWIASLGTLFFSDNASTPAERIFKLVPPATTAQLFLDASGSNGLAVDNDDKLIVADQRNHRIVRVDPVTAQMLGVVVPAGSFTPNDVIVRSDNSIYFTDPASGFYQVSPAGVLTGPMRQVGQPNGVELSLDENTLYVGDVGNRNITRFPVAANGSVDATRGTLFVQTVGTLADGMAFDCAGNLYVSTQSGVEVYAPGATMIGTIPTGEASNATFGGLDRKTLYVASRTLLKAVTLSVPGLPD